ncbi:MAG: DUF1444 family protein [Paracoccaceae bacterium]
MVRFILTLIFVCNAGLAVADVPRPESYDDTLALMRDAYLSHEEIESAVINAEDQSLTIKLKSGTELRAYPDNLHQLLQAEPSAAERERVLEEFVAPALSKFAGSAEKADRDRSSILPVIRPTAMMKELPDASELATLPFAADLSVFFVFDSPDEMSFVLQSEVKELSGDQDDLLRLAQQNFSALDVKPVVDGEGPYFVTLDGNYEATVLLDTAFWKTQEEALGEVIVAPLARDLVLFADRSIPGQEDIMRDLIAKYIDQVAYPLTDRLLLWNDGGWVELPG